MIPRMRGAFLALLLLPGAVVAEKDYDRRAQELDRLRAQIKQVQTELERERARQGDVSGELRGIDQNINRIIGRLRRLDEQQQVKLERAAALRREFAAEEARVEQHKRFLARQLVTAYAMGREAYLKLLLNQEDPARLDRALVYHRYLQRARAEHISAALAQISRLRVIEDALKEELSALEAVRGQQEQEQAGLRTARAEREQALVRIEQVIASKGQQLNRLQGDEAQLRRLLDELRNALADIPDTRHKERPFKERRGDLGWPLEGELAVRFGDDRGVGQMRWSGLVIEAQSGATVRAVSAGHVVFADWLRGMGLLLILDHGDGYMSLYGHNEAIYKEAGDWVQPGEVIAVVGASGGRRKPGLYFEIRAGGKPVDPLEWLRPRRGA